MTAWSDALDQWAGWCRAAGHSEQTIYLRGYVLRQFAARCGKDPYDVTLGDCARFVGRPNLKPESRRSARATLRSFYSSAVDLGLVDVDPTGKLPRVRIPEPTPRPTPDAILEGALATATDRDRLVLLLAALAGLRRAEIAGLRWEDVTNAALRIRGKGGKIRVVPLHPTLAAELEVERQRRDAGSHGTGYRYTSALHGPWIFPGTKGGPITPDGLGKSVPRALAGYGAHTLRHRFATNAYRGTRDLLALQQLLGHSKPETTTRYARADLVALEATVLAAAGGR